MAFSLFLKKFLMGLWKLAFFITKITPFCFDKKIPLPVPQVLETTCLVKYAADQQKDSENEQRNPDICVLLKAG